jgi:hypothetical protein
LWDRLLQRVIPEQTSRTAAKFTLQQPSPTPTERNPSPQRQVRSNAGIAKAKIAIPASDPQRRKVTRNRKIAR